MTSPPAHRPLARAVAIAVLLAGGALAAARLPLSWEPSASFPEISVALALPEAAGARDVEDVARLWVVPIESAARALGDVTALAGEVHADSASLRIRFASGVDATRKAARLSADLAALRARLPAGGGLDVVPASAGEDDRVAVLSLAGADAAARAESVAAELRGIPGVRAVDVLGAAGQEIIVRLRPGPAATPERARQIQAAIADSMAVANLGETTGTRSRTGVWSGPPARDASPVARLNALTIPTGGDAWPLAALATIERRPAVPRVLARFDGEPGIALSVRRLPGASVLALGRALDAAAARLSLRVEDSQARPLERLLASLALGLLLATLAGALGGWILARGPGAWRLALAPLTSLAAALLLAQVTGVPLDVATLPALAIGLAAALPLFALRAGATNLTAFEALGAPLLAAALPPIAVALAGGRLAPVLALPARAFAVALAGGAAVAWLHGEPARHRRRSVATGRQLRHVLRDPPTVLIASLTVAYALFAVCGPALSPVAGSLAAEQSRLAIQLSLPDGTTIAETAIRVRSAERAIASVEGVARQWSWLRAREAHINVEVDREWRDPQRLRWIGETIGRRLRAFGGTARVVMRSSPAGATSGLWLADELEARPWADAAANGYGIVLRSPDAMLLPVALARIEARAAAHNIAASAIRADWGAASSHLSLSPRLATTPAEAARTAARLQSATIAAAGIPFDAPSRTTLRVLTPGAGPGGDGEDDDRVPQRLDLFEGHLAAAREPLVTPSSFELHERLVPPSLSRQGGLFVLPVRVAMRDSPRDDARQEARRKLDRSIATVPLPAGVSLERPALDSWTWNREKTRTVLLAALLPALLFAAAALWLDSLVAALAPLGIAALGLGASALLIAAGGAAADEMTILALACAAAGSLPATLAVSGRILRRSVAGASGRLAMVPRAVHRTAREMAAPLLCAAAMIVLLLGGAALRAERIEDPWAGPLRAAAALLVPAVLACTLVLPAALLAALQRARRDPREVERLRHPPAWLAAAGSAGTESGTLPTLSVRSLTKRYRTGFRALTDVSFELGPGIVGLLGPNGAGKTTLMRLLTGLLSPTRGQILFRGAPVVPESLPLFRRFIGFLPQEFNAYPGFTAEEFLDYWALERGMIDRGERQREIARLLEAVGLADAAGRKVRDFSGGMRQRIGIARALLGSPPLLIVDEPTTGLDIESRNRFREILIDAAADRIVILSTHIAGDVEATATRLILLHRGRLRFDGSPGELVARARGQVFETTLEDEHVRAFSRRYRVTARVRVLEGIRVRAVAPPGTELAGREIEPNLEEAYLSEIDRSEGRGSRVDGSSGRFVFSLDKELGKVRK